MVLRERYGLVLDPFDDVYGARAFSESESALIGDVPMTISIRKAREFWVLWDGGHVLLQV